MRSNDLGNSNYRHPLHFIGSSYEGVNLENGLYCLRWNRSDFKTRWHRCTVWNVPRYGRSGVILCFVQTVR